MKRAAAPLVVLFLFGACNAILGNEKDYTLAPAADDCVLTSDCSRGRVCIFRTCSPPCAEDIDCPVGARCLKSGDETACVTPGTAACPASDCPESTICRDGQCRNPCEGPADCLAGQSCRKGVCVGDDPQRDPSANVGGASGAGGQGGAGGEGGDRDGAAGSGPESMAGASQGGAGSGGSAGAGAAGEDNAGGEGGAAPCVPRGAEDCLNGMDDDCNGDVDCADSACDGPVECVPDVRGADLGTLLPMGSVCPTGYSPVTLHRGLNDPFTCEGCSCRPTEWRCQSGVYGHGAYACPSFQFATVLYNLYSDQCNLMPPDPSLHFYPVSGFAVCEPEGVGTPSPASWTETRTFCKADRVGGGCPSGQRCVQAASAPDCVMSAGATSCGASYPDDTGGVLYTNFTDERTCTCSCAFGTADCTGGYIEVYPNGACTGAPVQMGSGAEGDACPLPIVPQTARIVATPTSPRCESNTFPFGEVTPSDPRTVCCR